MLGELKECFLEAYDDNQDGKIEIREVGIIIYSILFILFWVVFITRHVIEPNKSFHDNTKTLDRWYAVVYYSSLNYS